MLRFSDIHEASPGTLVQMLNQAYAAMLANGSVVWQRERERWSEFDRAAFASPEVGRSSFLCWHDQELVGFGSFDPRGAPQHAEVGHNCVLPAYQRRGYGGAQLREILRRIKAIGVEQIHTTTLDIPFFLPAQKMYCAAGFQTSSRTPWVADTNVYVLHLQKPANKRLEPRRLAPPVYSCVTRRAAQAQR